MKRIFLILGVMAFTVSCNDDLTNLNVDPKNPASVPAESLLANAEKNLFDYMTSTNVNTNVFRLFSQHWTETTYLDESRYDVLQRNIGDNTWRTLYRDVLRDLQEAQKTVMLEEPVTPAEQAAKNNRLAIIETLNIYTYSVLVDIFGNVPYSEALDAEGHPTPAYDDAETIYADLFERLDVAIANIDPDGDSFSADVIYGGDMAQWLKFANSLKLRMAITVADAPGLASTAQTAAEEAVASGVFESTGDSATVQYLSVQPNTNPLYEDLVTSGRYDFIAANTLVDYMNGVNDPRRGLYYTSVGGAYIGGPYAEGGDFFEYSSAGDPADGDAEHTVLLDPTLEGILMNYIEVEFLLAEAVERGWSVGGTAASHYNNAVNASILYWGGSQADADAYLLQPSVAYATAGATWQEKIGMQAWLGLYNRGFEAWTSYRRLDYPQLVAPASAVAAAEGQVPKRITYPVLEQTLNATNYNAAGSAIGGDKLATRLFWDVD
ncbi:SusD/RagB family nutrient-binding outer membrane lipoprotein [Flavobacterium caeni]|uniref:Starch-binding associating with outer membrane n=1 Tax=Flavobacterium caeni TaxID=490189 RepID=A0A1G5F936_9FLAO|nr:SusD/RagB family nutrient-binding outer membrane lipoprotein [Flavobacterium caeni]SCY35410.1 Starch-binding associating with outer membrane [Flavobacterium caeni]